MPLRIFILGYFLIFGALTAFGCMEGGALIFFMTLFLPGIEAPTILLYSVALIPLGMTLRALPRYAAVIVPMALIPLALAVGPGQLSQQAARDFAARISADDLTRPSAAKPKSIELVADSNGRVPVRGKIIPERWAPCSRICMRLLFNGEVDWVRMTLAGSLSVTYRIEHRDNCPQPSQDNTGDNTPTEKALRDRLIAGDCLISGPGGDLTPDAVAKLTVRYDDRFHPSPKEVGTVVNSVKVLQIETRQEGTSTIVLQQTETTTSAVTVPLNIFAGPTIQRNTVVTKPIDLAQALRDAFGYQIAAISPPPPLDKRKIVEGFLALPAGSASSFTAQQRDLLGEVLREVAEKPTLSDTDIDFVRRTVADDRVTNGSVGGIIQTMFYKHPAQFEPLIPVVLERMTHPAGDTAYKGALGWSLRNFSADRLQPYRDKMMSIVETEGKGPSNGVEYSNGVLIRLAELGSDDAVNMVIRRLDPSRPATIALGAAAIAACRANQSAWPMLEPAVLARLTPSKSISFDGDEEPLLLALARFGETSRAVEYVQKRGLNKVKEARTIEVLDKLKPGFDPIRCGLGL